MIKPYYETELGKLYHGDCLEIMPQLPLVDMVITSPPYDDLRDYGGYVFDYKRIAFELFGLIRIGGVTVWVVGDQVKNGSETGSSFRQALYFKDVVGFNIHDTMIYQKNCYPFPPTNRYYQQFEYMFVFSKGTPSVVNLLRCKSGNKKRTSTHRNKNGTTEKFTSSGNENRIMDNVWFEDVGYMRTTKDKIAFKHPAIFPESLCFKHVMTWSNENDVVLDPMCGSGTVCKMSQKLNRRWIGIEIEEKYCEIAAKRIEKENQQLKLFT